MVSEFQKLKQRLTAKAPKPTPAEGLSTGLTLLNLALSGHPDYGLLPAHYYLMVGDSQAGKTFLLMQLMCEAEISPRFKKYRKILDAPERGNLMDLATFFPPLVGKIQQPSEAGHSRTLEEFYDNVGYAADKGKPFFYGLDSEDALPPEADLKKAKKDRAARKKPKAGGEEEEIKGSYGVAKAKQNSTSLRVAHNSLEDTESILCIIKQTRDNIDRFTSRANPKTRSGGKALSFYASAELWFSIKRKIYTKYRGANFEQGTVLQISVKKNRFTGCNWPVFIPFYPALGFDETGSMCDFLIAYKHWKGTEKNVTAPEIGYEGPPEALPAFVEAEGHLDKLKSLTVAKWRKIEAACRVERKRRYE